MKWMCWITLPTLLACGTKPVEQVPVINPEITEIQADGLEDFGTISRAVALETREDCLIGRVAAVKVNPVNGDLLVIDKSATKTVYRFNSEGGFLNQFGGLGMGPGEYETLLDAEVDEDGSVVLLTDGKLIRYNADGSLIRERRIDFVGYWIEARKNLLYVYMTSGMDSVNRSIGVFDENLRRVREFHPYDRRFNRVGFIPFNALSLAEDRVFVSELYDFRISAYDLEGRPTASLRFANFNGELEGFWSGSGKPTRNELKTLFQGVHRPIMIHAFGDLLYLLEVHDKRAIRRSNLLDTRNWRLYRFQGLNLVGRPNDTDLSFDHVAGSFENGLIGVCDSPQQFQKHKSRHRALQNLSLAETDNPILVFFSIHHPATREKPEPATERGGAHEGR